MRITIDTSFRGFRNIFRRKQAGDKRDFYTPMGPVWDKGIVDLNDPHKAVKQYKNMVANCVNLNANVEASVPLRLYRILNKSSKKLQWTRTREVDEKRKEFLNKQAHLVKYMNQADDVEEITDHAVNLLLTGVNSHMNSFDLRRLSQIFLDLTGDCYWYIPKNGAGVPGEIWVPHSQWMRIVPDKENLIKAYIYQRGSKKVTFEPDEIIHFKYWGVTSYYYGTPTITGAEDAIALRNTMTKFDMAMIGRGGTPPFAFSTEMELNQEDMDKMHDEWDLRYGGPEHAGKPAILDNGLKIQEFGHSPAELGFDSGMSRTKEDITNSFGIPINFWTDAGSNRAVSETGFFRHAKIKVAPDLIMKEEKLNEQLLPKYRDGNQLFFAHEDPVPPDVDKEVETIVKLVGAGVMTIDEGRKERKLPPIGMDRPLQPMNLIPVGEGGEEVARAISAAIETRVKELMTRHMVA